ncbi:hypothetical protein VM1G_09478 [Cytospora mali]|uniref:Uncharacterized protein n=1 Tax=Cytospora mali TaxID=578113 RepID=A0A194WB39_CYTMA|nr:hypothetical protein VM1G_09478 [Valsa mali]
MASISDLPAGILLYLIQCLQEVKYVSALSRSGSRFIYNIATPILYSCVKDEPSVMCWACDEGQSNTVRHLLDAGADPNALWVPEQTGRMPWTLRHTAIKNGNIDLCKVVWDKGLKPPPRKELGSLISKAVETDSVAALEYLLGLNGASGIMLTGPRLHNAISDQRIRCAKFLIEQGAPIGYQSKKGETCSLLASKMRENALARKLLKKGADPNTSDIHPTDTPLIQGTVSRNNELVVDLLEYGAIIHGPGVHEGALTYAISRGFLYDVRAMANSTSFADATKDDKCRYVFLALALPADAEASKGSLDAILNGRGVDPNCFYQDLRQILSLQFSIIMLRPNAITMLLKHGAGMHRRPGPDPGDSRDLFNPSSTTSLELAIRHVEPFIVRQMLNQFPSSPADAKSWQADELREKLEPQLLADYVRAACYRMKPPIFEVLIESKLDFSMRDPRNGDTALHMICEGLKGYMDGSNWEPCKIGARAAISILLLLERLDIDPKIENDKGVSALQLIRQTMEYGGDEFFWKEVAEVFGIMLIVDDDSIRMA